MQKLLTGVSIFFLLLWFRPATAEPIEIKHRGLDLLGNLAVPAQNESGGQMFLLIHGTWAHHEMEIMTAMQQALSEIGLPSLAVTLSLGVNQRRGFLGCDAVINADHGHAVDEIAAWVSYLESIGYVNVVLTGHSRGGNQVMLYSLRYPESNVTELILLAPMSMGPKELADQYEVEFGYALSPVLIAAKNAGPSAIKADILQCRDIKVTGNSFLSYYGREPSKNTAALLAQTSRPIMLILGSEDVTTGSLSTQSNLFVNNRQIKQVTIEGANHFFRDLYMDEVVEAIGGETVE